MTPEEAEKFMYKLRLDDYFEGKVLIGEGEKVEVKKYEGRVVSMHRGNKKMGSHFYIDNEKNDGHGPQIIFPRSILEHTRDSPLTRKFGNR